MESKPILTNLTAQLNGLKAFVRVGNSTAAAASIAQMEDALKLLRATLLHPQPNGPRPNQKENIMPVATFEQIKVEALAVEFSRVLRVWLSPEDIAEVNRENTEETDPNICHSHDYCDANMAMDEAAINLGLARVADLVDGPAQQKVMDVWNSAWTLAKQSQFDAAKIRGAR
jgi:hypothetical protein